MVERKVRLRARARWVCALRAGLGLENGTIGQLLAGRWTPDLPDHGAKNGRLWAASLVSGARVLGTGTFRNSCKVRDDDVDVSTWVALGLGTHDIVVVPELLAKLSWYAWGRPRAEPLFTALKMRAAEWAKSAGLHPVDAALVLPGTVALAVCKTHAQKEAEAVMSSRGLDGAFWFPWATEGSRKGWWTRKQ
uniref:Uncharacterized protein n=1 Tax=Erysiphales associated ambiguivirus 1 TaxID=2754867 RepID=A0A7D6IY74_9VIRU|nr:hypothetical protein [Erysiphales associated ambiguivirus 1]